MTIGLHVNLVLHRHCSFLKAIKVSSFVLVMINANALFLLLTHAIPNAVSISSASSVVHSKRACMALSLSYCVAYSNGV